MDIETVTVRDDFAPGKPVHAAYRLGLVTLFGEGAETFLRERAALIRRVTNVVNGKRADALWEALKSNEWRTEMIFDAAHGRRRAIAAWRTGTSDPVSARRVALAAARGWRNTNPELSA